MRHAVASVKSGLLHETRDAACTDKMKLILLIKAGLLDSTLKRAHLFSTDLTKFNLTFKLFQREWWQNFRFAVYG
jgi:hypothetical protein